MSTAATITASNAEDGGAVFQIELPPAVWW